MCVCVCLSVCLVVTHSCVSQATHAFLWMLPLCLIMIKDRSWFWFFIICEPPRQNQACWVLRHNEKNGAKKAFVFMTLHLLSTCALSPLMILHLYIYQSSDLKNSIALNIVNAEHVLIICGCKITVYGRFFVNRFYEWNNATLTFENPWKYVCINFPSICNFSVSFAKNIFINIRNHGTICINDAKSLCRTCRVNRSLIVRVIVRAPKKELEKAKVCIEGQQHGLADAGGICDNSDWVNMDSQSSNASEVPYEITCNQDEQFVEEITSVNDLYFANQNCWHRPTVTATAMKLAMGMTTVPVQFVTFPWSTGQCMWTKMISWKDFEIKPVNVANFISRFEIFLTWKCSFLWTFFDDSYFGVTLERF